MKRKVAIFDIDGTIFRSSLLIEITEALIDGEIFPEKIRKIYSKAFLNWQNRQGSYEDYINAVVDVFVKHIKGVEYKEFTKTALLMVAQNKDHVCRYTSDLIKELRSKNYYILAISHSPKDILDEFCDYWGFDKVYGMVYEVKDKKFTGKVLYDGLILDKGGILQRAVEKENLTLKDSVGVGDTESDIKFLQLVQKPICFNPNQKLYLHAKKMGWQVVVERKDVIYKI